MEFKFIDGGVCAAKGYKASGVHCGIRKNKGKKDLALIVSDCTASAAACYTQNLVKGAPILVTKKNIMNGTAKAVICNSGNANTCNADGEEKSEKMCRIAADVLGLVPSDVIVASTGVIGQILPIEPIESAAEDLKNALTPNGSGDAAEAIMTTDTVKKQFAVEFTISDKKCVIGAIAKGSGMIHPNMATMLSFVTSDVSISSDMLKKALSVVVDDTFNMVSVDGDTSTNDMVAVMANGLAENKTIAEENEDYEIFKAALFEVLKKVSMALASDGEGASHLIISKVVGAPDKKSAKTVAKSVACSSLLKAAIFGADANWGRVLCAIGYAGVQLDVEKIDVDFASSKGVLPVCRNGAGVDFSEEKAKEILLEKDITIDINLNSGKVEATAYGCDLTYDYVKINGDYRT